MKTASYSGKDTMKSRAAGYALSRMFVCIFIWGIIACTPNAAMAAPDSVSVTFSPIPTVTEGSSVTVTATITYDATTSGDTYGLGINTLSVFPGAPDPTDSVLSPPTPASTCPNGVTTFMGGTSGSCTLTWLLQTTAPVGSDTDTGSVSLQLGVALTDDTAFLAGNGGFTPTFASTSLTVQDPPSPVTTPEPSTLVLLGAGVLGLMGMGLYKRRLA